MPGKTELVERIAFEIGMPKAHAARVIEVMMDAMVDWLKVDERVVIPGFGSFYVSARPAREVHNPRSGELVAVAPRDKWFAYYWWLEPRQAPPFARHIDIHRKPGYDPCELWFDWPRLRVPTKPELVKGSHGRDDAPAACIVSGPQAPERCERVAMTDVAGWILDCFR